MATLRADSSPGWSAIKRGMTPAATFAALGKPLVRTAGRGFELWIYDHNSEVLFFRGPVIAWTAPDATPGAAGTNDTFEWPVLWTPPGRNANRPAAGQVPGAEYLPGSSFLYGNR
ncbi:MAG TPA: hypothetical protein VGM73_16570 [Candidatus Didemnitutus sp.]